MPARTRPPASNGGASAVLTGQGLRDTTLNFSEGTFRLEGKHSYMGMFVVPFSISISSSGESIRYVTEDPQIPRIASPPSSMIKFTDPKEIEKLWGLTISMLTKEAMAAQSLSSILEMLRSQLSKEAKWDNAPKDESKEPPKTPRMEPEYKPLRSSIMGNRNQVQPRNGGLLRNKSKDPKKEEAEIARRGWIRKFYERRLTVLGYLADATKSAQIDFSPKTKQE